MQEFFGRLLGAALLRSETYEQVEADRSATLQSGAVVALSAVAAGIGSFENGGLGGVAWGTLAALIGWYLWAYVTYWIGTRWLPGPETSSDHGELLRTIGFSSAPGILRALGAVGGLGGILYVVCGLWMLVTMVVAVRQALDYHSTGRAIAVCAIGFPIYVAILVVTLLLTGPWPV